MNLRVDLILASEQRSASILNVKSLVRIASIAVPCLIAVLVGTAFLNTMNVRNRLKNLEREWAVTESRQKDFVNLSKQLKINKDVLTTLEGWKTSRLAWREQLPALREITPKDIQLTRMATRYTPRMLSGRPARGYESRLDGIAVGKDAGRNVQLLRRRLKDDAVLKGFIADVKVVNFQKRTGPNVNVDDRLFSIVYTYNPLLFK